MWIYQLLNVFFLIFHLGIVIFNLSGWIWIKTRKANLVLLLLTGLSWFGLGLIYGIGYCPFTEWHWQVLHKLGKWPAETSYIQYLIRILTGWRANARLVDVSTMIAFLLALAASLCFNIRDYLNKRKKISE